MHYALDTSNVTPVIGLSPESHFKRREIRSDNMSEENILDNSKVVVDAMPMCMKMRIQIPEAILEKVDRYVANRDQDPDAKSHDDYLVGQIRKGKQLSLDPDHEDMAEVVNYIQQLAQQYCIHYYGQLNIPFPNKRLYLNMQDIWSVHSFAGDYNPIHYHETDHKRGLSFTFYTKVPQQILDQKDGRNFGTISEEGEVKGAGPYGAKDGFIHFVYGEYAASPHENFRFPPYDVVCPERGLLLIWPKWLPHYVPPFEGDGERISIAGNVDVWFGE